MIIIQNTTQINNNNLFKLTYQPSYQYKILQDDTKFVSFLSKKQNHNATEMQKCGLVQVSAVKEQRNFVEFDFLGHCNLYHEN